MNTKHIDQHLRGIAIPNFQWTKDRDGNILMKAFSEDIDTGELREFYEATAYSYTYGRIVLDKETIHLPQVGTIIDNEIQGMKYDLSQYFAEQSELLR